MESCTISADLEESNQVPLPLGKMDLLGLDLLQNLINYLSTHTVVVSKDA